MTWPLEFSNSTRTPSKPNSNPPSAAISVKSLLLSSTRRPEMEAFFLSKKTASSRYSPQMAETSTCPTSGQQKNNLRAIMQTTGRTARTRHIPRRDGTRRPNASTPASPRRWRNRCATFCGHSDRQTAHISPAVEIAGRAAAPVAYADIAPQLG